MKVIYLNCGWRHGYESDLLSYEHFLSSSEKKAWKKNFRPVQDLNPWPLRYWCSAVQCSALPTELTNPIQAWIFFKIFFRPSFHYCKDRFHIHKRSLDGYKTGYFQLGKFELNLIKFEIFIVVINRTWNQILECWYSEPWLQFRAELLIKQTYLK